MKAAHRVGRFLKNDSDFYCKNYVTIARRVVYSFYITEGGGVLGRKDPLGGEFNKNS